MKYAIYFSWNDGIKNSFNVKSAKERDFHIKNLLNMSDISKVSYCKIYSSGEYGSRILVSLKEVL